MNYAGTFLVLIFLASVPRCASDGEAKRIEIEEPEDRVVLYSPLDKKGNGTLLVYEPIPRITDVSTAPIVLPNAPKIVIQAPSETASPRPGPTPEAPPPEKKKKM